MLALFKSQLEDAKSKAHFRQPQLSSPSVFFKGTAQTTHTGLVALTESNLKQLATYHFLKHYIHSFPRPQESLSVTSQDTQIEYSTPTNRVTIASAVLSLFHQNFTEFPPTAIHEMCRTISRCYFFRQVK